MSFRDAVRSVFHQYVGFSGRARRSEYWFWTLFTFLLGVVTGIIDRVLGTDSSNGSGVVTTIVDLTLLLPSLAVAVRRLHDTSRSAWWLLLVLVPIIGWIALLVFSIQDTHADNVYGPAPKGGYGTPVQMTPYQQA